MSDKLIDLGFASITYSAGDNSSWWNNALTETILSEQQLKIVEDEFSNLDRKPTIYFENTTELKESKIKLEKSGYKFSFEDVWQFWKSGKTDKKYFDNVVKVEDEKLLEVFLKTFDGCYQKNDPQNPYGELGDYLEVAKKAWRKHWKNNRLEYFIVYK